MTKPVNKAELIARIHVQLTARAQMQAVAETLAQQLLCARLSSQSAPPINAPAPGGNGARVVPC